MVADVGMDINSPTIFGPGILFAKLGARKIRPVVANTLKMKPDSNARNGFIKRIADTAAASVLAAMVRFPLNLAKR